MGWDGDGDGDGVWGWGGWVGGWVGIGLFSTSLSQMPCQGYLFSMSTIHFATFTVTGFCRICQFSLFSQVSTVGLHLDNSVSNAMPGLLVFHVHHTFCNFHSDWVLQDLPTFFFSLLNPVVGFCRICQLSFSHCSIQWLGSARFANFLFFHCSIQWLGSAGFANFLFLISQSAVSLANQSTPNQLKLLPQFVYGISPQNPPHPP